VTSLMPAMGDTGPLQESNFRTTVYTYII
jgi:hypothetical protein